VAGQISLPPVSFYGCTGYNDSVKLKNFLPIALTSGLILAQLGCNNAPESQPAPKTAPEAQKPATTPGADPHTEAAPDTKKAEGELSDAKAFYEKSKAAFEKAPSDANAKEEYVKATVGYATITMNSPTLGSKDKYPGALKLYREALTADPKNEVATNNAKMIEDIYKSMGREVPK